jgi:hypothetical protein
MKMCTVVDVSINVFLTSELVGGEWSAVSFTLLLLYLPGKSPLYPVDKRLGGALEPGWTVWRSENS